MKTLTEERIAMYLTLFLIFTWLSAILLAPIESLASHAPAKTIGHDEPECPCDLCVGDW